jgi:hypothetical protein
VTPRKLSAAHALLVDMLAAGRGRTSGGSSSTPDGGFGGTMTDGGTTPGPIEIGAPPPETPSENGGAMTPLPTRRN